MNPPTYEDLVRNAHSMRDVIWQLGAGSFSAEGYLKDVDSFLARTNHGPWIKIEPGADLPGLGIECLVSRHWYKRDGTIGGHKYDTNRIEVYGKWAYANHWGATHFMPIPEPPNE